MTFSIGYAGVAVSGVLFREKYNFELTQIGLLLGCMALGIAFSELIWGGLTDFLGDKFVLIIGLFGSGMTFGIIGMTIEFWKFNYIFLCILLIIAGIFGGSVNSSSGRAVMSWFNDKRRGLAMSIRQTAIPIGASIGAFAFPNFTEMYGFELSFLILSFLCGLATLSVIIWIKKKEDNTDENIKNNSNILNKSPYKRWDVWKIAIIGGILTFPQMAILTFGSVYLDNIFSMETLHISLLIGLIQLVGGSSRILMGAISDKYKNRNQLLFYTSLTLGIFSIGLGIFTQNVFFAILLLTLLGIIANAWTGIAYTEIAEVAGINYAGRALGMIGTTVFISSFLIPYIIPFLIKYIDWQGLWLVIGILSLTVLILIPRKGSMYFG
ncbi:MFS transporter [Staphylococcus aureus]|uniref:MFS transporter n=2 Tax=Staphylococcus aureus TaxID=1280 RepID=UPI0012AEF28A|nr:MFS transporter [Staphylococcus aureus]MCC5343482.1 MFS transporter [Staphylococcus aureus]MRX26381.1 MFS transporter [Staphylococcus aureus]BDV05449.1 MFS transporter [Staphylococcus aureus]HDA2694075.1 MFS transporter [Staphylococcus aureus]HDB3426490.1 MFS transporter [Staphylococcus aureus]